MAVMARQPRTRRPDDLEAECRKFLEFLRKNCPELLPPGPVEPGRPVEPLRVTTKRGTTLVQAAVKDAAADALGRRPTDPPLDAVVWTDGADSLLVLLDSVRLSTAEGIVTVSVDVACDQLRAGRRTPQAHVEIDLVVGTDERPAGLLAAATTPRGPAVVVDRWADALVAFAWQALLDTAAALSAATGADVDGTPLIPAQWSASRQGIAVGPQARHPFDRQPATGRRPTATEPR
jgi:hypothetical protein